MKPITKLINLFVFLSVVFLLPSCGTNDDSWIKHDVKEGGFTIKMPKDAKTTEKLETTVFGKQKTFFFAWKPSSFAIDKFKLFQVAYTNCPANVRADSTLIGTMLDNAIEIRKKDFTEAESIESQYIELNGYPGRAFFYDAPKGNTLVSVKICIAGDKLYDLVVISKKNYSTNDEINSFFNSFSLL